MAKKTYEREETKETAEEAQAKTRERIDAAVNKQVQEDARKAEADAIETGKNTELADSQVWVEAQDENPFKRPQEASIAEVKKNADGKVYVKYTPVNPAARDVKANFEYLTEDEFRARFVKLAK